jgi:molybdate transport system ATP-binding protein
MPACTEIEMLSVAIEKRLANFTLDVTFETTRGVTALFGHSGAGKTSIVNMIAGLMQPDGGRIALEDRLLYSAESKISAPVHRRRIGYVFQDGRLFPHMTVAQNLDYGRWMNRLPKEADETARIVALLGLAPLLARRPRTLSGGERQRVAIGRALLSKPRLLLLDEPLASLDTARKAEVLPFLRRLRDEVHMPMVYVSHQTDEVREIATSVVRLEGGRIVATGGLDLLN